VSLNDLFKISFSLNKTVTHRLDYLPRHRPALSSALERVLEQPGVYEEELNPHRPSETGSTNIDCLITETHNQPIKDPLSGVPYLSQETTVAKVDHQDLNESRGHSDVIFSPITAIVKRSEVKDHPPEQEVLREKY